MNKDIKLLIDLRNTMGKRSGVGRYISNLAYGILALKTEGIEFHALCSKNDVVPTGYIKHSLNGIGSNVGLMNPLQQLVLPWSLSKIECDLYHYPGYDPPWVNGHRFVATCYDIEPLIHKELFSSKIFWYYKIFSISLRRAKRVIVISENTGNDVCNLLNISRERIRVIYLGIDWSFRPIRDPQILEGLRRKYLLPDKYLLYLGNFMPHKNLRRLISAMKCIQYKDPSIKLVLAGQRDKYCFMIEKEIISKRLENVIKILGFIAEEDLPALLSNAIAFVYPSLYEGFGLPVLEAMACGTPVVTSGRGSIKEVVGDSAVIVNPEDVYEIADGIKCLLDNSALARRLSELGQRRSQNYTWRRCAEKHLDVYHEVLNR